MSDNQYYVEKYRDYDKIIKTLYSAVDSKTGRRFLLDGIVNPLKIDNRQLCAPTDNQGSTPHCAGYSICQLAEAVIWKNTGKLVNLEGSQVYALAKTMDGDPNGEGTWLEYAIKAAFQLGGFDVDKLNIGFLYNSGDKDDVIEGFKFLVHKYDFLHVGFNIKSGWYNVTDSNYRISDYGNPLGGHAVLVCGYDQEGCYIQNQWGVSWGAKGFGLMPWSVFKNQFMYACCIRNLYDKFD